MSEPAGTWLRVSTTGQDETSQLPDNTAWIRSHDYTDEAQYVVHGHSAFKGNRAFDKAWNQVISDMRSGKIRVLVVWKSDRIDRKLNTFAMLKEVVDAGGRVEFVTQPHLNDLTTMGGRISLKVQEEIAYAESKDKSDRIRIKHSALRAQGSFIGRAPWGYVIITRAGLKTISPTEEGLRLVPEIFGRVIKGESLADISAWLEAETGRSWWPRTLGQMIRNRAYTGYCQDSEGRTIHTCEAMVDAATFRRAGEALDTRPKRGPQDVQNRALLAGVTFCPSCPGNSPMYRISTRSGLYYRCSGRGSQRKGCGNMIRLDKTDATVHRFMADLNLPIMARKLVPGHSHEAEIEEVKFLLRQLDPDAEDYDSQHAALRSRLAELKALPSVPDHWEDVPTGQTYAQRWAEQDNAERGAWLKSVELSVWADSDAIEIRDWDGSRLRTSFI
jgi:DNA invertase Pin-like site-specific DNA recombinase